MMIRQAESRKTARPSRRRRLAVEGEQVAMDFLSACGYSVLARNWRAGRFAEIDIIALSPEGIIVFVEVKTRIRSQDACDFQPPGLETINWRKQQKIVTSAALFLTGRGLADSPWRLDVILVEYDRQDARQASISSGPRITHIPAAFGF